MKVTMKKTAAWILAGAMAVSMLSGCGSKKEEAVLDGTKKVATVNGTEIPMGVVSLATRIQQAQYEAQYALYSQWFGAAYSPQWDAAADEESGETRGQQMVSGMMENVELMYIMKEKAADYGVELTEENISGAAEAAAAFMKDNSEESLKELGVTEDQVKAYLEMQAISQKIYDKVREEAEINITDEEANQSSFTYITVNRETEETENTEAEAAEDTEGKDEAETSEEEKKEETEASEEEKKEETEASEEEKKDEAEASEEEKEEKDENSAPEAAEETKDAAEEAAEDAAEEAKDAAEDVKEAAEETAEDAAEAVEDAAAETVEEEEEKDPLPVGRELADLVYGKWSEDPTLDPHDILDELGESDTLKHGTGNFTADVSGDADSTYPAEVLSVLHSLGDGELCPEVIETETLYYIVRLDKVLDETATEKKRSEIEEEQRSAYYTETTDKWMEEADIKVEEDVLKTLVVTDSHVFNFEQTETEEVADDTNEEEVPEQSEVEAEEEMVEEDLEKDTEAAASEGEENAEAIKDPETAALDAAEEVKDTAKDAAEEVKDTAEKAAEEVKDTAEKAVEDAKDAAADAAEEVKDTAAGK